MSYQLWLGYIFVAPDGNPTNFTGSSLNSTHIYLSWDPPPASQVNGIVRGYHLNITEAATGQVYQYVINDTYITVGSLHPFYVYHCTVAAFTVQTGSNVSFFSIKTAEDSKFNVYYVKRIMKTCIAVSCIFKNMIASYYINYNYN